MLNMGISRAELGQSQNPGRLYRAGERFGRWLISKTPLDKNDQIATTLESMGGTKIVFPDQQSEIIKKNTDVVINNRTANVVRGLVYDLQDESRLGSKALDLDRFKNRLTEHFEGYDFETTEQRLVVEYWLRNFDRLPQNKTFLGRVWGGLVEDRLGELGLVAKLAFTITGIVLKNRGQREQLKFLIRAGDRLIDTATDFQISSDAVGVTDNTPSEEIEKNERKAIADRYNIKGVKVKTLTHPEFGKRISRSFALNWTIYTVPRYVLGYAAFFALSNSSEFHNLVNTHPGSMNLIAGGVLGFGAAARAWIDSRVLVDRGYSPDPVETPLGLLTGSVDENLKLKANPKAGIVGPLLDLSVSSFAPTFSWAWVYYLPYSVPAYLWAMYVDQVVFATTNVAWGTHVKMTEQKSKSSL